MNIIYWVKFTGCNPERWVCKNIDEFWYRLREFMLRNNGSTIEWLIRD